MKALVISGGGSKGAFAGGVAQFLMKDLKREYDIFLGTSAGSLLIPHLSLGNIEKVHGIFTSVKQSDIFDVDPFLISGNKNRIKTKINHLNIIKMFLRKKKTFGESLNLRNLIRKMLTREDFSEIKKGAADVVITVANLTTMQIEYKSAKKCSYEDFCDWIWASSNVVPFMSLLQKNGFEYADGGLGNNIPVSQAIRMGATDIDVIILKAENPVVKNPPVRNVLELTERAFDFMLNQIQIDDLLIGCMEGMQKDVNLNVYRPPELLSSNSLIFNSLKMKEWWAYGLKYARENSPDCHCIKAEV